MKKKIPILMCMIFISMISVSQYVPTVVMATSTPFSTMSDAFDGTKGTYYGVNSNGTAKNTKTNYVSTTSDLLFDVGNNQVFCSVSNKGLIRSACAIDVDGKFRGSSQWPFYINNGGADQQLDLLSNISVDLLGNYMPIFTFNYNNLKIQQLVYAPTSNDSSPVKPRAVIVAFRIDNTGSITINGSLKAPAGLVDVSQITPQNSLASPESYYFPDYSQYSQCPPRFPEKNAYKGRFAAGYEAIKCLDSTAWNPSQPSVSFSLAAGASTTLTFACFVGESVSQIQTASTQVSAQSSLNWLNQTYSNYSNMIGTLQISSDPYYSELYTRYLLEAYHSCMMSENKTTVNDDGAGLLLPIINPTAEKELISSCQKRLISTDYCHGAYNSFFDALPGASALYYQMTGDNTFFTNNTRFFTDTKDLVTDALTYSSLTGSSNPFLFYNMQIWDSPARGNYHTGSNVIMWHSLKYWSQIASSAYSDTTTGNLYNTYANNVYSGLDSKNVGTGTLGSQYYEGAFTNGTKIAGHDGEETASTLAPMYGMLSADDSRLLNYKKLAFSLEDPGYNKTFNAINYVGGYGNGISNPWGGGVTGPTSPGYVAGLSGASSEGEVLQALNTISTVTDLDGSVWWWPYKITDTSYSSVRRRDADWTVGKVGYTAAVYCDTFIYKVAGITFDYPTKTINFKPLSPWNSFQWDNFRMGNSMFNIRYYKDNGQILGEIKNLNSDTFNYTVDLPIAEGGSVGTATLNGTSVTPVTSKMYGRKSYKYTGTLAPNETKTFVVNYTTPTNMLSNANFELGNTFWTNSGTTNYVNDKIQAHNGNYTVKLGTNSGNWQDITTGFTVGATYNVSGYGKFDGTTGTRSGILGVKCYNSGGTLLSNTTTTYTSETCFVQKSLNVVIPANTTKVQVYAWNSSSAANFYVDDLALTLTANQVDDPGFEVGNGVWSNLGNATITNNSANAKSGNYYVAVTGVGGVSQNVAASFTSGNTYTLGAYGKMSATGSTGYVGVKCYNSSNTMLQENYVSYTSETAYTSKTVSVTIPTGTTYIQFYVWKATGTPSFSVDDISFK